LRSFKDNQDREWEIVVNTNTAERVRDKLGVDVFKLYESEGERVFGDPILLVNLLYVLCEAQATKAGISDYDFGAAMVGGANESAMSALLDAVADFFPPSQSVILRKIKTKAETMVPLILSKAAQVIDSFAPTSGEPSTSSPALSV
jgi:hypothetical protein